jgi:ABC-type transport system involved in cytochrome bd biosynthesis fused ATPase/permease subunit
LLVSLPQIAGRIAAAIARQLQQPLHGNCSSHCTAIAGRIARLQDKSHGCRTNRTAAHFTVAIALHNELQDELQQRIAAANARQLQDESHGCHRTAIAERIAAPIAQHEFSYLV